VPHAVIAPRLGHNSPWQAGGDQRAPVTQRIQCFDVTRRGTTSSRLAAAQIGLEVRRELSRGCPAPRGTRSPHLLRTHERAQGHRPRGSHSVSGRSRRSRYIVLQLLGCVRALLRWGSLCSGARSPQVVALVDNRLPKRQAPVNCRSSWAGQPHVYQVCRVGNWHVRFGLRREATQHREGCWRTDDRRSPHRMTCGAPARRATELTRTKAPKDSAPIRLRGCAPATYR
jgi:hypothetical protein